MKVILIGATTLCGRISPAGQGSLLDRRRLETARDVTGASIMGANTLRVDDPEMRGTDGSLPQNRFRCIISRSGSVDLSGKKLFEHGPSLIFFTSAENTSTVQKILGGKGEAVSLPEGSHGLQLQDAIGFLADKGVESLLVEGGARLNFSALAQGVVDEILLTIIPGISGNRNSPSFADGPYSLGDPFLSFELLSCETVSTGEVFLHYRKLR